MAKSRTDQETLCIQRTIREIDRLDDARAMARVATYLQLRYTRAGDDIIPRNLDVRTPEVPPVEGVVEIEVDGNDPVVSKEGEDQTGWDLSARGSEKDDKPPDPDDPDDDPNAETEVEI